MFLRGRRGGSSMNLLVGTAVGIGSGWYLFHDIFGQRGEKLLEYNQELKRRALEKQQEEGKRVRGEESGAKSP